MRWLAGALGLGLVTVMTAHRVAAQNEEPVSGEAVYKEECKECHGLKGTPPERAKAKYKKIKAIAEDNFISGLSEDSIVTILTKGIDKNMKSFKDKLCEPEMKAVAAYVKQLGGEAKWANEGRRLTKERYSPGMERYEHSANRSLRQVPTAA
jgi:mono/diheme cytochrome c family protein